MIKSVLWAYTIAMNPVIASKHNFLDPVKKLRECLQVWKLRSLSLAGKILVFNTLALSKLIYVAAMIAPPKQFIDEANRVQNNLFGITNVLKLSTVL